MANKIITLNIDGKEKHMKLGINALTELEKVIGKPLTAMGEEVSLSDLRAMFYVSLKWEDKNLTIDKAGDLMDIVVDEHGFQFLSEKLGELMTSAMGGTALPSN